MKPNNETVLCKFTSQPKITDLMTLTWGPLLCNLPVSPHPALLL